MLCAYSLAVLICMNGSHKCPLYTLMEIPASVWIWLLSRTPNPLRLLALNSQSGLEGREQQGDWSNVKALVNLFLLAVPSVVNLPSIAKRKPCCFFQLRDFQNFLFCSQYQSELTICLRQHLLYPNRRK